MWQQQRWLWWLQSAEFHPQPCCNFDQVWSLLYSPKKSTLQVKEGPVDQLAKSRSMRAIRHILERNLNIPYTGRTSQYKKRIGQLFKHRSNNSFSHVFFKNFGAAWRVECHLLELQQNSEESGGLGGRLYSAAVLAEFIYYNNLNEINHFFILTDTVARMFCFKNCCKTPNDMAMMQVVIKPPNPSLLRYLVVFLDYKTLKLKG